MPKVYESSLGIRRSFCGDCGTPLSYEAERLPSEVYDMVGVLDKTQTRLSRRRTLGSPRSQSGSI
jgi:hypothetical protein